MERRAVLVVVLCLLTLVAPAELFRFDLVLGKAKCVAEDVPLNVMTVGTYTVVNESHASTLNPSQKITVKSMTTELKKMGKTVEAINEEMLHLREREAEMQDMNTTTSSKMALFTLLSIAVCLSVAGLQLYHLKTFSERKKLL